MLSLMIIEIGNDLSPKSRNMKHTSVKVFQVAYVWLAQLDKYETSDPMMVSVVGSIPTGGNFLIFKTF